MTQFRGNAATTIAEVCAYAAALYRRIRELLYGMRLAWVSTASVALGLLLFYATTQAQDLFLEAHTNAASTVLFWMKFYLFVLLVWVAPVYLSSLWILPQSALELARLRRCVAQRRRVFGVHPPHVA